MNTEHYGEEHAHKVKISLFKFGFNLHTAYENRFPSKITMYANRLLRHAALMSVNSDCLYGPYLQRNERLCALYYVYNNTKNLVRDKQNRYVIGNQCITKYISATY